MHLFLKVLPKNNFQKFKIAYIIVGRQSKPTIYDFQ